MAFFKHAWEAIQSADLVLEVVDARFAEVMQNKELEWKIISRRKHLILVLNKMDLMQGKKIVFPKKESENVSVIAISCFPKRNISQLRALVFSKLKDGGKIAVIGYPNSGKSSVINALTGRHAAPTSKQAGFTRGKALIRLKENVYVFDTPGIIPVKDRDEFLLMLVNAKSPNQLQDVENAAVQLLEWLSKSEAWGNWVKEKYGLSFEERDGEGQLEALALHFGVLGKHGVPDLKRMAMRVIMDWQSGQKKKK